jgi:hypothetical protein
MRSIVWVIASAVSLCLKAVALAQDTVAGWKRRPIPDELRAVWPYEALRRGLGGRAELD